LIHCISNEGGLEVEVKWRLCAEGRRQVDLHEPWFEFSVYQDINTSQTVAPVETVYLGMKALANTFFLQSERCPFQTNQNSKEPQMLSQKEPLPKMPTRESYN
jgi:hypothetical protein